MSDDFVNQLTLNYLISKDQLHKLNKKMKQSRDDSRAKAKEQYDERIRSLFHDMLVGNPLPEDLLSDVKNGFDFFIDKCMYYFEAHDQHQACEKERIHKETEDEITVTKVGSDSGSGSDSGFCSDSEPDWGADAKTYDCPGLDPDDDEPEDDEPEKKKPEQKPQRYNWFEEVSQTNKVGKIIPRKKNIN